MMTCTLAISTFYAALGVDSIGFISIYTLQKSRGVDDEPLASGSGNKDTISPSISNELLATVKKPGNNRTLSGNSTLSSYGGIGSDNVGGGNVLSRIVPSVDKTSTVSSISFKANRGVLAPALMGNSNNNNNNISNNSTNNNSNSYNSSGNARRLSLNTADSYETEMALINPLVLMLSTFLRSKRLESLWMSSQKEVDMNREILILEVEAGRSTSSGS